MPEDLIQRNMFPRELLNKPFPAHKVIGNIYFVGSWKLASFVISTPEGLILVNSSYEKTVPAIREGVEKLGFKFTDIKILLNSHAHGDHMEGDAMVKELSGAKVMMMAEDIPAAEKVRPGGKPHPVDRVLHDGDTVSLGGTTMTAHLTPGHTKGATTWTLKATEGGKTYDVVIVGSMGVNPGLKLINNPDYPQVKEDYMRMYKTMRELPCDVALGPHPGMYGMEAKYALLGTGPNPYIDPEGCKIDIDLNESIFWRVYGIQRRALEAAPAK